MDSSEHPAAWSAERLLAECQVERTRRSGPGGQHRNKVETAVVIRHRPSGVSAEANERRSQAENRDVAVFRLRLRLALEIRGKVKPPHQPSPLWLSRCRHQRISVNPQHDDFPSLLAEALDVVTACDCDLALAAATLKCTSSQLIKFLQLEPRALAAVNRVRLERGLHRLK